MSVNAQGGEVAAQYLPGVIRDLRADVVDVQECGDRLAAILAAQPGMHTARYANLCLLSRWPLSAPDSMPRAAFARVSELGYGGTALVVRFRVANPARAFDFVMLHLETPRKGIEKLMGGADGFIPDGGGVPTLGDVEGERINARIRRMESERASVWASRFVDSVPVIVAGDFNMPVESSIFRQFWTRFDDAFEAAGLGFGYTKTENRYIHARIDHVLYAPTWFRASGAWVGPEVGSDHRPVIADLAPLR
jgi:endonuclease/exonuclease/phosphatase (EEP) superfamily protein YafD